MIVKGSDDEALVLERCLSNMSPYVDKIFITATHKPGEQPNERVVEVANNFDAVVSHYEWKKDFADARNFSFSQVTKEYDYIIWSDADDIWRGLDKLKETIESNKHADAFSFWYLYDFDEYKQPTVVHAKTMVVKNDGCVTWKGKLHEDLQPNRSVETKFVEGIERLHLTNDDRVHVAALRNVEVSKGDLEENPNDPRTYWNYGNSLIGAARHKEAVEIFHKFIKDSGSKEEKYLARLRLATIHQTLDERDEAINNLWIAIGMKPEYPDAYYQIGHVLFTYGQLDEAEHYLLQGLVRKPPYHSIIVYNPRDYDYNPMMLLAKVYFQKNRPDLALPMLEGCLKIYPNNERIKNLVAEMKIERDTMATVIKEVERIRKMSSPEDIILHINSLDPLYKSHPAIVSIRNQIVVKDKSSGKDLVIYCGMTEHEWNPKIFREKGFGGSEEAVIHLSRHLSKLGWNVTVYNKCGVQTIVEDGITWKPFWEWNYRDKQDVVILWRSPKALDFDINCENIFVDLHDVIPPGEFNEKRLAKLSKVFLKTQAHRSLFPNVPDEKIAIIPNGIDIEPFEKYIKSVKKDPYLIINTSSPDRSMDVVPKIFKKIKERVPQARMKWAYGWGIYEQSFNQDKQKMDWKKQTDNEMAEAGIENLGKVNQDTVAKLYCEAGIFLYPTEFYEIDCISAKKAQLGGAYPLTTNFAALNESVQFGHKIPSKKDKTNWAKDYQFHFGVETDEQIDEFVNKAVETLGKQPDPKPMIEWAKKFDWNKISQEWHDVIKRGKI